MKWSKILGLILIFFVFITTPVWAESLSNRIAQYPRWHSKPSLDVAKGDLIYPQWMAGTWQVKSVLIDQVAPLYPEIVTPGFEQNKAYLNEPIIFNVKFIEQPVSFLPSSFLPAIINNYTPIIADRAFNTLAIGKAYLGDEGITAVKVDPRNPNRQITFLPPGKRLISTVIKRGRETPNPEEFITTEITEQRFENEAKLYLNEVETTTRYQLLDPDEIVAEQITAIYLSPQDPKYFKGGNHPVALYRYQLTLAKIKEQEEF